MPRTIRVVQNTDRNTQRDQARGTIKGEGWTLIELKDTLDLLVVGYDFSDLVSQPFNTPHCDIETSRQRHGGFK